MILATTWYNRPDPTLLDTLMKSISECGYSGELKVITPPSNQALFETSDQFREKVRQFMFYSETLADGELVCLVDSDCVFLKDPEEYIAKEPDFDLAFTPRAYPFPFNTGILFFKMGPVVRDFIKLWEGRTLYWGSDEQHIGQAKRSHGGTDQAAFADAIGVFRERNNLKIHELGLYEWNLCQDWHEFNDDATIMVHFKGAVHRNLVKGRFDLCPHPVVLNCWKRFRPMKRWDEIAVRLSDVVSPRIAVVGVWHGVCCSHLLGMIPDLKILMVDAWERPDGDSDYIASGDTVACRPQHDFVEAMQRALKNVEFAFDRTWILKGKSVDVAGGLHGTDHRFDLVFLDGDHSESGIRSDIEAWLPLVCDDGWLSSHDYENPSYPGFGVKKVVDELYPDAEVGEDHTWFTRITK